MGLKQIARALMTVVLVTVALGIAGCGSSGSSSRSSAPSSGRQVTGLSAPLRVYRVLLTGRAETPHGAAHGSGDAVIAITPALSCAGVLRTYTAFSTRPSLTFTPAARANRERSSCRCPRDRTFTTRGAFTRARRWSKRSRSTQPPTTSTFTASSTPLVL